ncbi:hypothetical protein B296_00056240, partial [Ensete ventricosum]
ITRSISPRNPIRFLVRCKTLRTKDEQAKSPLRDSPFVQEIQDEHIPSHFCLPMLEAYDGSSDPTDDSV